MKKIKFFAVLLISIFVFIPGISAAGDEAMIGTVPYATLEDAYTNANDGDTIVLKNDVMLENTLVVSKKITIDLNGYSISKNSNVINVDGGSLVLTGTGVIKETAPDNAGVKIYGSSDSSVTSYSYLEVGKNVTIEAWAPVFVSIKSGQTAAYGVSVDIYGKLVGLKDQANQAATTLYVNGTIQDKTNYPVINVHDGATISGDGTAMYLAGYADVTVGKAQVTGVEAGIAIKAGSLTLNGTNVKATGASGTPTTNNNGINGVGAAIQIESSDSYGGDIEININGGTYESTNNSAIVEYLSPGDASKNIAPTTATTVEKISITDGTFVASDDKDAITASDSFKTENTKFISGGTYSSSVKDFLADGLVEGSKDNNYQVTEPKATEAPDATTKENPNTADNIMSYIAIAFVSLSALAVVIANRKKYLMN